MLSKESLSRKMQKGSSRKWGRVSEELKETIVEDQRWLTVKERKQDAMKDCEFDFKVKGEHVKK